MTQKTKRNSESQNCWVITEGIAGTENQCLAVANSLSEKIKLNIRVKRIGLRQPWKTFSPFFGLECPFTFTGDKITKPWPEIVIASGRKSIAASLYIKRKSRGKTFTLQIQDPRICAHNFDLLAVPAHDKIRGDNVIVTHTAPNLTTAAKLKTAVKEYKELFGDYKNHNKVVTVLIGGNSKTHRLTPQILNKLCTNLLYLKEQGHSLLITTSRRTSDEIKKTLRERLGGDNTFIWTAEDETKIANPYIGMLAYADAVIVTEDSVSMVSDALQTQVPVYTYKLEGGSAKFNRFYTPLKEQKLIESYQGFIDFERSAAVNMQPAAQIIAQEIVSALK